MLSDEQRFDAFCGEVEPRLRRALVAAYGPELGRDAAADALTWAWQHLDRVEAMDNPAGYLWRVGQTSVRRAVRQRRWSVWIVSDTGGAAEQVSSGDDGLPSVEPGLISALDTLSPRQRSAVLLVHGHGWSLAEAAEAMGCRIGTLRNHLDRGLTKLRDHMGVTT